MFFVLVLASQAWAQRNHPQSRAGNGNGNGGGAHAGQIHPGTGQHTGMMSPQQQMENEFWQNQMMLNEMMAPRRPARHPAATQGMQAGSAYEGNLPTSISPNQGMSGGSHSGGSRRSKSSRANSVQGAQSPSAELTERQSNGANLKKGGHKSSETAEARKQEMANRKHHSGQVSTASRNSRAADNQMAAVLKDVHASLHLADTDYQGHRVKAMSHVANAINRLGGNVQARTDYEFGGGNLPQAESDRILDDAMFHLRNLEASLETGAISRAHQGHARTSVAEAIRELEIARA
jgi:hypothetical protein